MRRRNCIQGNKEMVEIYTGGIFIDSFIEIGNGETLLLQEFYKYDIPEGNWLQLVKLEWTVLKE